jgi:hypothetical protein
VQSHDAIWPQSPRDIRAATRAASPVSLAATYKSHSIREYFDDVVVEELLVTELKCVEHLAVNTPRDVSTICEPQASPFDGAQTMHQGDVVENRDVHLTQVFDSWVVKGILVLSA